MSTVEATIADDAAILERIARRDPEGVSLLYDRYSGVALSFAYRILHDRQAAEDSVQEAFLNVWRRAATYDAERGTVRAWFLTIVHHQAINLVRTTRSRGGVAIDIDSVFSLVSGADTAATVVRGMHGERLHEALATLSPGQRQVVELAYFGGLSHSEIARTAALPLGTVKGRMRLALAKLRHALQQWEVLAD